MSPNNPADWIESAARDQPQRIFLQTPAGRAMSYAGLSDESGRFAAALIAKGVAPGDRIAVQVDTSVEAVLLYIACLRMRAVFVPINVANTAHEVEYFLRDAEPKLAVIRPADRALLETPASRAGVPCETLGTDGEGSWMRLVRQSAIRSDFGGADDANSLAAIVYTSGTTGRSKGAMLTRANLASNATVLAETWRFTRQDVLLHALPLFHVHGLFAAINTVLASGSGVLLLPKFDAAAAVRHFREVSVFMGVPTHYTRLLQQQELDRAATDGMRLFVSGSAPLLAETHREFSRRTGHTILERYGMTETLMNTSNPYEGVRKPGSVGVPLAGTLVRVTGPVEEAGEIEVKGPNVFAGYWRDPQKTQSVFTADGWFKTGDLGRIAADGYVHIVGRAKDLVISGGYNVYPKEVEMEIDALAGVLESAVFGVPHPDFGEGVTAVVVCQPGAPLAESDIVNSLQARLARYKIPKRVLVVDELPRNSMGKVQKNVLRATYASLYAAAPAMPAAPR
jgi:malonyl-CoA/methylmalonyl-CoA synthetase